MDVTKMEFYICSMDNLLLSAFGILFFAGVAAGAESCTYIKAGKAGTVYCEYGCCGTLYQRECCSYSVSTSVVIVAGVVGGLVFIALVSAIIVCCVKKYKDKQASRVRELHHGQRNAHVVHVRRYPATVPKPPTYTESPPAYSSEMPESHFRPITVNGNYVPYNQRFNTPHPPTTTASRTVSGSGTGNPPLQSSNQSFQTNTVRSRPQVFVTAVPQAAAAARNPAFAARQDPPPPYREFERGRTPANRRRRFIQSPGGDTSDASARGTSINNAANTHPNVPLQRVPSRTETSTAAPGGHVAAPPVVARISRIPTRTQNMTPSRNTHSNPAANTSSNVTSVTTTPQRPPANMSQNSANIPDTTHVAAPSLSTGNTARQTTTGAPSNTAVAAAHNTTSSPIATTSQSPDDQQRDRAPSRTLALLHARIASRRNKPGNIRNIREENIQDIDDLACL